VLAGLYEVLLHVVAKEVEMNIHRAVFWSLIVTIVAGCQHQRCDTAEGVNDENKADAQRWIEEGFNSKDLAVVDQVFADEVSVDGRIVGRAGVKTGMSRHLTGFPDLHVTIDDSIAEGNKVAIWYTVEGTHSGEFAGIPPTGRHVRWAGVDLLTFEHGKIAQARFLSDFFGLMSQLSAKTAVP
jgi:steroid delta-isomerase-like uncharacterized protein